MSLMFLKLVFLKKNVFPQHKSCWLCRQLLTCHSIFSFSSFSMFLQSRISKSVVICFFCYFLCYFLLSIFSILLFFSTLLSIPCSVFSLCLFFFFLIGIHSMQGWTTTTRHGVTKKRSTKRLKYTGNLFRKNLQLKEVC